ncbi:MAG TPA: PilZ domain-containing protein [Candidatus Omnitrophota bacterium]|nr:PilZ domain-containing protein [Candidatus Omnitrophota bacterium]
MILERGSDRRRFQRLKLHMSVYFRVDAPIYARVWFGDQEMEADMVDISEQGMGIRTRHDIPLLTTLRIRFSLFKLNRQGAVDFSAPFEMEGEVRSNISGDEKDRRLGICFIHQQERLAAAIGDFASAA